MSSFTAFAFVVVTAIAYYYAGKLILTLATLYLLLRGWLWCCRRYPRTAIFIFYFMRGLLGGGRRRRG